MKNWQLHEAKTRLSEIIESARTKGPQIITLDGAKHAAVLSIEDFHSLTTHKPGLRDYLLGGPKVDDFEDFEIEPDRDMGRVIAL